MPVRRSKKQVSKLASITSITGWKHPSAPLRVEGTLAIPAYGSAVGKRLLVPLVPFASLEANAFHAATRVNGIYFEYPYERRDDITLHLPPGYGVESLPKPPEIHQPAFVYSLTAAKQGDALHVTRDLELMGFYFPVKFYPSIRTIFSMVKTGDDDQAGGAERLDGDPRLGVVFQQAVQHGVRDLIAQFVGMSFCHRFGGEHQFRRRHKSVAHFVKLLKKEIAPADVQKGQSMVECEALSSPRTSVCRNWHLFSFYLMMTTRWQVVEASQGRSLRLSG